MKTLIILIVIFTGYFNTVLSQNIKDSISCSKSIFPTFYLNGVKTNRTVIFNLLNDNKDAYTYVKNHEIKGLIGGILLAGGTICIANFIIYSTQNPENFNNDLDNLSTLLEKPFSYLAAGIPLTIFSIYIFNNQGKNLKKSIKIYNTTTQGIGNQQSVTMNYGLVGNGLGVQLNF